jgi:hypothetical protein
MVHLFVARTAAPIAGSVVGGEFQLIAVFHV